MTEHKPIPKMTVGKYAGVAVDKLPHSYLRWLITQNFSEDILACAKEKLSQSEYSDLHINVSRHAIDMFSKRFLYLWLPETRKGESGKGLGTFIAELAQDAWDKGVDVSKRRHGNDGVVREFNGVCFVFGVNPDFPEYKDVITIMAGEDR